MFEKAALISDVQIDRSPAAADARYAEAQKAGTVETLIPQGPYCYRFTGEIKVTTEGQPYPETVACPFWGANPDAGDQEYGYCAKLGLADWIEDENGFPLLWDMVKECGINDEDEDEEDEDEEDEGPLREEDGG